METPICPTCGCSLVRLGISKDEAVANRSFDTLARCSLNFADDPHRRRNAALWHWWPETASPS